MESKRQKLTLFRIIEFRSFAAEAWVLRYLPLKSRLITLGVMFLVVNARALKEHPFGNRAKESPLDRSCIATLICCVCILSGIALFEPALTEAQESVNLDKWLQEVEGALAKVENYTAVFHRVEFVDGKLIPEEVTVLKFKRPFKIYMKWIRPSKGQESLYIQGANHDKIRAHGNGLMGFVTVNLDPIGTQAMENSRHPITEAGLHNLVGKIAANLRRGLRSGELVSKDLGEQMVYGRKTRELEGILPKDASKGYYCYRCVVNVDLETKMPIRTRIFDWDDRLVECYGYEHLKLNPGLSAKDFDPKNPEYHF